MSVPHDPAVITDRGRSIYGPTPPGGWVPCERDTTLSPAELDRRAVADGEIIRTRTCTGHSFVAPGDEILLAVDGIGVVEARFEEPSL